MHAAGNFWLRKEKREEKKIRNLDKRETTTISGISKWKARIHEDIKLLKLKIKFCIPIWFSYDFEMIFFLNFYKFKIYSNIYGFIISMVGWGTGLFHGFVLI
jgi:hypothetical protein